MIGEVAEDQFEHDGQVACVGQAELFFPVDGDTKFTTARQAGTLCRICPALKACGEYADKHYQPTRTHRAQQVQVIAGRVMYDSRLFREEWWAAALEAERDKQREYAKRSDPSAIYKAWDNRRVSKYEKLSENRRIVV